MSEWEWQRLVYLTILLVLIGPAILSRSLRERTTLRNIALVLAAFAAAALVYQIIYG
jgi:hypothetical protein